MKNTRHRLTGLLAIVILLAAFAQAPFTAAVAAGDGLAATGPGQLQWFGYAAGTENTTGGIDEPSLIGTDSYTNWGEVITDADQNSLKATQQVNALAQHNMKAIIELGLLLWCAPTYTTLCPDYTTRWTSWKDKNSGVLTSTKVLGFIIRDEPFHLGVDPAQWESAARMVKNSFMWDAKILLVEAAYKVADPLSSFNQNQVIQTVDWVAVDKYVIHPKTDQEFQNAIRNLKTRFPGRRLMYIADGWWDTDHQNAFGSKEAMAGVMREWYEVAAADPAAVLLAVFIWNAPEGSLNFPPSVLAEQTRIGREITGRTRTRLYQPTGLLNPIFSSGNASGWACDPDGAWGEVVRVDFYSNGQLVGSTTAGLSSGPISQCRSGLYHNYWTQLTGQLGQKVTAIARDLDGGSVELPARPWPEVAWVQPSGVTWGPPNTLTVAGWARNGTGGVQITWRDLTTVGPWNVVAWQPVPSSTDASWSNTIPVSNYCHDYQVYATYSGASSSTFTYRGLSSGYCNEQARMIWVQPQPSAGYGPPGSLIVAGSATGAPAGTTVTMWWRDATAGTSYILAPYAAPTDANGIWLNSIPNADYSHRYAVYVKYDVVQSGACVYQGTNSITWC